MKRNSPLTLSLIPALLFITFTSLATEQAPQNTSQTAWDFDHKLQFKQTQLSNKFRLEVIPNNKINFERMAGFLLRKSLKLCQGKSYNLQIIKGIESYNDQAYFPNRLSRTLIAEITCSISASD